MRGSCRASGHGVVRHCCLREDVQEKGLVCTSSGLNNLWFVSSRLVVLSRSSSVHVSQRPPGRTAQTRQASFAIANTRPSHRRKPFDRREMTRGSRLASQSTMALFSRARRAFSRAMVRLCGILLTLTASPQFVAARRAFHQTSW